MCAAEFLWTLLLRLIQLFLTLIDRFRKFYRIIIIKNRKIDRFPKHLAIAVDNCRDERIREIKKWCYKVPKITIFDVLDRGICDEKCKIISGKDSRFKIAQLIKQVPDLKDGQSASAFVMQKLNGTEI
jgi:hypothetical protein